MLRRNSQFFFSIVSTDLDAIFGVGSMDDLAVADVDAYMSNGGVIEYQVTRQQLRSRYGYRFGVGGPASQSTSVCLISSYTGNGDAKVCHHTAGETGTVGRGIGQFSIPLAAILIAVGVFVFFGGDKLKGIINNGLSFCQILFGNHRGSYAVGIEVVSHFVDGDSAGFDHGTILFR